MWKIILSQFFVIMLFFDESLATHGIFRVPLGLPPTFDHQHFYVQPQQQLYVYPQIHGAPMPQYYQSPQSLYIPQNAYGASRYIVQSTGGYYDPVVSYIHHQNPYQTTVFTDSNLHKELFNQKLGEIGKNMDNTDNQAEGVTVKSGMEPEYNKDNEQDKKEVQKMLVTSNNSMETTTVLGTTKDEIFNPENSSTARILKADSDIKV